MVAVMTRRGGTERSPLRHDWPLIQDVSNLRGQYQGQEMIVKSSGECNYKTHHTPLSKGRGTCHLPLSMRRASGCHTPFSKGWSLTWGSIQWGFFGLDRFHSRCHTHLLRLVHHLVTIDLRDTPSWSYLHGNGLVCGRGDCGNH